MKIWLDLRAHSTRCGQEKASKKIAEIESLNRNVETMKTLSATRSDERGLDTEDVKNSVLKQLSQISQLSASLADQVTMQVAQMIYF